MTCIKTDSVTWQCFIKSFLFLATRERIRAKDVRPEDRVFLVQPQHMNEYVDRTKSHLSRSNTQNEFTQRRAITVT